MSKLKPCPFCGEKATLDYSVMPNRKHWFITCDCCGMMYQDTLSQRKYVKDGWNTRPIEDELRAENVRLNSWLDEVIKQGNYLEHTLRLAYEHVNGHAFVHGWRDMVNHIQKEREE